MAQTLIGTVTSDKRDKTITVSITSRETHPLYRKQYSHTRKYTAHDEKNEAKIGSLQEVLCEGYDNYIRCYFGRSAADAPEIDGKVFFISPRPLTIGEFYPVRINDTLDYDLLGELEE